MILLEGVARRPEGDVILCDVAREDTSVVLSDLKELRIHEDGSIALEVIDTELSRYARRAEEEARGAVADSVVWEEVEERSEENVELSAVFCIFMVLAALIAAVGIYLDSPILIVGAMVVGPEFGPIAGVCVALVQSQRSLPVPSFIALAVGLPLAITVVFLATLVFKATGLTPEVFDQKSHQMASLIANPDFFAFFVACCAGAAGMLSLSTAKSGALIGVLISVTTIPAAANINGDAAAWRGSMAQLALNMGRSCSRGPRRSTSSGSATSAAGDATSSTWTRCRRSPDRAVGALAPPHGRTRPRRRDIRSSIRPPGGMIAERRRGRWDGPPYALYA